MTNATFATIIASQMTNGYVRFKPYPSGRKRSKLWQDHTLWSEAESLKCMICHCIMEEHKMNPGDEDCPDEEIPFPVCPPSAIEQLLAEFKP